MISEEDNDIGRTRIRVGIVGLGRVTSYHHLPALLKNKKAFHVVAVCDLIKERRDLLAATDCPNVRLYRQFADMVDDPDIDLFLIACTSREHIKFALSALARSKWVVLETPMAWTHDEAMMLRAAAVKARGRLIIANEGAFSPEFLLAKMVVDDKRLGALYDVRIRRQTYLRRDDWQSICRCGGGIAYYDGPNAIIPAMQLMRQMPIQLWSELKRLVAMGDAEDFAHITFRTRSLVSADIELNAGCLNPYEPAIELRGSLGRFAVMPGATSGELQVVDPAYTLPRHRSSVRTPPLKETQKNLPTVNLQISLPSNAPIGYDAFWHAVYSTVRTAVPFSPSIDENVEAVRYIQIIKKSSPYSKS